MGLSDAASLLGGRQGALGGLTSEGEVGWGGALESGEGALGLVRGGGRARGGARGGARGEAREGTSLSWLSLQGEGSARG